MNYKDVLIRLASMTVPYVYDDTISFLELDRKLYKIVHELIVAMQGLNTDYEQFKTDMTNSFNSFTDTINNNFDEFKSDVNNQISVFEENMNTNFNNFKTEIENNFNTLQGEFNTLKTYVDNYFANLNLDEEVQTVIQKMYDDGTLANIINEQVFNELNTKINNLEAQVENIITDCGTGTTQQSGGRYYVYSTAFGTPVDKQLFTIQMPNLPGSDWDVLFYNKSQSSGYTGWKLNNVKALDVSNGLLLVQASVVGDTTSFNIVGILPNKEIIVDKISDLLVTNCGTGNAQQSGGNYYIYSEAFGTPVDKQLFTIQMPNMPGSDWNVLFYNKSQSSDYTGWKLNNVKALDVSNGLLLVQASVVDNVISFNIIAGKNVDTIMNLEENWEPSPIINSTIGTVSNQCLSNKYIGDNQYKLSGFFSINNTGGSTTGNITIDPLLSPSPVGTPAKGLFVLKFDGASQHIEPIFINWTGEAFVLNNATITQNESAHYFIVPQVIKFE